MQIAASDCSPGIFSVAVKRVISSFDKSSDFAFFSWLVFRFIACFGGYFNRSVEPFKIFLYL